MPRLITAQKALTNGASGALYWLKPVYEGSAVVSSEIRQITLPASVYPMLRRPSWARHVNGSRSRIYGVGGWSSNLLVDENFRGLKQHIQAPTVVPVITGVTPTGVGVTGVMRPYLRYVDAIGERYSPLSRAGDDVTLTNQARSWSNIPTSSPDSSVTHVEALVSVAGALARVAWRRQLGMVTPVLEEWETLSLGAAEEGAFVSIPAGTINVIYNEAQLVAGNEQNPQRWFWSALGYPERWEGLYVDTDGERTVGGFVNSGLFIYGSRDRIYRAQGFTALDLVRDIEKDGVGLVGHHGNAAVPGRGVTIVPRTDGIYLFAGEWRALMSDKRAREWREQYQMYPNEYEAAQGFYDPEENVYRFGPVPHTRIRNSLGGDCWTEWVLDVEGLFGSDGRIAWSNDAKQRKEETRAAFYLPGSARPEIVAGGDDGILRRENVANVTSDDSDSFNKKLVIEPATIMPDPGGGPLDANIFHKLWSYVRSELGAWTLEVRVGNEQARQRIEADFSDPTPAGQAIEGDSTVEARGTMPHILECCAGRALNYAIIAEGARADDFRFRGFGGTHGLGIETQGFIDDADVDTDLAGLAPGQLAVSGDGGGVTPERSDCGNPTFESLIIPASGVAVGIYTNKTTWLNGAQPPYIAITVDSGVWAGVPILDTALWNAGVSVHPKASYPVVVGGKAYMLMMDANATTELGMTFMRLDDNVGSPVADTVIADFGQGLMNQCALAYDYGNSLWYMNIRQSAGTNKIFVASSLGGVWTQVGPVYATPWNTGSVGFLPLVSQGDVLQIPMSTSNQGGGWRYTLGAGDGGGDWTALPAFTGATWICQMIQYYDHLGAGAGSHYMLMYKTTGGTHQGLYRYAGNGVATLIGELNTTANSVWLSQCTVFNGKLYFLTQLTGGAGEHVLNSYDGVTLVKDIYNFGANSADLFAYGLTQIRGNLALVGKRKMWVSNGTDVSSFAYATTADADFPDNGYWCLEYPFARFA